MHGRAASPPPKPLATAARAPAASRAPPLPTAALRHRDHPPHPSRPKARPKTLPCRRCAGLRREAPPRSSAEKLDRGFRATMRLTAMQHIPLHSCVACCVSPLHPWTPRGRVSARHAETRHLPKPMKDQRAQTHRHGGRQVGCLQRLCRRRHRRRRWPAQAESRGAVTMSHAACFQHTTLPKPCLPRPPLVTALRSAQAAPLHAPLPDATQRCRPCLQESVLPGPGYSSPCAASMPRTSGSLLGQCTAYWRCRASAAARASSPPSPSPPPPRRTPASCAAHAHTP